MLTKAILLLLPALAYGSIRVYIKASSPETGGHVEYTGASGHIVKDADIKTFGLEGDRLKESVKANTGRLPTHAFVKSPAIIADYRPEDIYSSYVHFKQVKRRIVPMTADIVNYKVETINIPSKVAVNLEYDRNSFKVNLVDERINTVEVTWVEYENVSKGANISYVIDFGVKKIDEIVNLSFKAPFGKTVKEEKEIKFSKEVDFVLERNQVAGLLRTVDKVTMELQVNYTVGLRGDVACYFQEDENHPIWGYDVNDVLKAAKMPNTIEIRQLLTVEFYSNPKVEVKKFNQFNHFN